MKAKIMELRQRLSDLKAKGLKALEAAGILQAKTDPTEDEFKALEGHNKRVAELRKECAALAAEIEVEEDRLEAEAIFAPLTAPIRSTLQVRSDEPDPRLWCGFSDAADFGRAVQVACTPGGGLVDPRLEVMQADARAAMMAQPANFHQESGSEEGYMVPPQMRQDIWEMIFAGEDLLNMVDMEPTSSNAVEFIRDETTPWGGTGIVAKWAEEGTQFSATKLVTKAAMAKLHKLYCFVLATDELLEDAPRLNNRLTRRASEAILWEASDAIAYGSGVGKPLGYFESPALVSVAKESGQGADTIQVANVLKMFTRLLVMGAARPFWLANRDIIPQLGALTIGNIPVWTPPSAGLTVAPGGFLLGFPIKWSEHAKTLGDKGDIQLLNLAGYYGTEKRGGIQFASSMHLFFDFGQTAFRWTFRMGGQPFLSAPVSPANGPTTKTHFVVLDERA